jgi:transcription termination factor Rho
MDTILKSFATGFFWTFNTCFSIREIQISRKQSTISTRIIDLFPYWKGQRGMIVAQPKPVKRCCWKRLQMQLPLIPEVYLIVLLIDVEVDNNYSIDMSEDTRYCSLKSKTFSWVWAWCSDFIDSITRLARAYNTVQPASGIEWGVDANALQNQNVSLELLVMLKMEVH